MGALDKRISEVRASSAEAAAVSAAALGESDSLPLELAILLHGVAQRFDRFDRQTLGEHDTDAAEYLVLSLVAMAGDGGLTPREMRDALQQTSGGMTRCLDRLERKGFIERRANTEDRRSLRVLLTGDGERVTRKLMGERVRTLQALFEPLGPARAAKLRDQLHAVIATLDLATEDRDR